MPVIEILVSPGDTVAVEDPLVTLESDKATMDVPAPEAGTIKQLRVSIGDRVSEGSVLLTLEADGAGPTSDRPSEAAAVQEPSAASDAAVVQEPAPPPRPDQRSAEASATPRSSCSAQARAATRPRFAPPTWA